MPTITIEKIVKQEVKVPITETVTFGLEGFKETFDTQEKAIAFYSNSLSAGFPIKEKKKNPYTFPTEKVKLTVAQHNKVTKFMDVTIENWGSFYAPRIGKDLRSLKILINQCLSENKLRNDRVSDLVNYVIPLWMQRTGNYYFEFFKAEDINENEELSLCISKAISIDWKKQGYSSHYTRNSGNNRMAMIPRHRSDGWSGIGMLRQGGVDVIASIVKIASEIQEASLQVYARKTCLNIMGSTVDGYIKLARKYDSVNYSNGTYTAK